MPPAAGAPALPTLLRMRRACSLTSSCEIRPAGPVPVTALMSTPISRARRRTAGEAAAGIRFERSPGGAGAGAGGGRRRLGRLPRRHRDDFGVGLRLRLGLGLGFGAGFGRRSAAGAPALAAPLPRAAPLPAAPSSTVKITEPTCTLSPFLTLISLTTPATDEGTSIVALSVSSSMTGCSILTVSPTLTSTLATSPEATFSPSSGTLNSVTYDTAGLDFSGSIPGPRWPS